MGVLSKATASTTPKAKGQGETTGQWKAKDVARPSLKRSKIEESDASPPPKAPKTTTGKNSDINVKMQNWLSDILKHPIMGPRICKAAPLTVVDGGNRAPLVVEDFDRALAVASAGSRNAFYSAGQ